MILLAKFLICLIILCSTEAKPAGEGDAGPVYNVEDELVVSVDSRSSFDEVDDDIKDVRLEQGSLFQGDIFLLEDQKELLLKNDSGDFLPTRTGIISDEYRWPKDDYGFVQVPFEFSEKSDYCEFIRS
jgi:hypothetical protein